MYRFEILNKLKAKLGDAITIEDEFDEIGRMNFYSVAINLGTGFAGLYEGGYWGDCTITNDELKLHFTYDTCLVSRGWWSVSQYPCHNRARNLAGTLLAPCL